MLSVALCMCVYKGVIKLASLEKRTGLSNGRMLNEKKLSAALGGVIIYLFDFSTRPCKVNEMKS